MQLHDLGNNAQHSTLTGLSHLLLAAFEQCLRLWVSIVASQLETPGCWSAHVTVFESLVVLATILRIWDSVACLCSVISCSRSPRMGWFVKPVGATLDHKPVHKPFSWFKPMFLNIASYDQSGTKMSINLIPPLSLTHSDLHHHHEPRYSNISYTALILHLLDRSLHCTQHTEDGLITSCTCGGGGDGALSAAQDPRPCKPAQSAHWPTFFNEQFRKEYRLLMSKYEAPKVHLEQSNLCYGQPC